MKEQFLYDLEKAQDEGVKVQKIARDIKKQREELGEPERQDYKEAENAIRKTENPLKEADREKENQSILKKVNIPNVGELEYEERKIMFSEKVAQETGGVRGYICKSITWEKLANLWGMQPEEFQKIIEGKLISKEEILEEINKGVSKKKTEEDISKYPTREAISIYLKNQGILSVISELTDKEFIEETFNHVIGGHRNYLLKGNVLTEESMIGKFGDPRELGKLGLEYFEGEKFYGCDVETNETLSYDDLFERVGIDQDLVSKYRNRELNEEDEKIFLEKLFKTDGIFFQQNNGINLTIPGTLWGRTSFDEDECNGSRYRTIPDPKSLMIGFKKNYGNSIFKEYCRKVSKIMQSQAKDEQLTSKLNPMRWSDGCNTNAFRQAEETLKSFGRIGMIGLIDGDPDRGEHPQIPIVLNNPDINELRWCHADFAAIPTKKGYNIIEFITSSDLDEDKDVIKGEERNIFEKTLEIFGFHVGEKVSLTKDYKRFKKNFFDKEREAIIEAIFVRKDNSQKNVHSKKEGSVKLAITFDYGNGPEKIDSLWVPIEDVDKILIKNE